MLEDIENGLYCYEIEQSMYGQMMEVYLMVDEKEVERGDGKDHDERRRMEEDIHQYEGWSVHVLRHIVCLWNIQMVDRWDSSVLMIDDEVMMM